MTKRCVAMLGRRDLPTDAVEEYCCYLAAALSAHEFSLEIVRVNWEEKGWAKALRDLHASVGSIAKTWVLVQYTALAWSRRGFSWRVLHVVRLLRRSRARVVTVFHDGEPYSGDRIRDRIRRRIQLYTMRKLVRLSDLSVLTVPPEIVPWVAGLSTRTMFVPVGANLPSPEKAWREKNAKPGQPLTVGVFSLADGQLGTQEAEVIAESVLYVIGEVGTLRVVVVGRNSEMAGLVFRKKFQGSAIELEILGMLPAEKVVAALGGCDVMLFVRGPISSRRGSAIAGIACGLPVVAYEGWQTASPVTSAGVVLVPGRTANEFGPALLRVLQDSTYRAELAERSRKAQTQHFSWPAIAAQYAKALMKQDQ